MYFPDPQHATAGIHFARVLDALGIRAQLGSRLHAYPNGAIALRQLASAAGERLIGIAQITEIAHAANVALRIGLPRITADPSFVSRVTVAHQCAVPLRGTFR